MDTEELVKKFESVGTDDMTRSYENALMKLVRSNNPYVVRPLLEALLEDKNYPLDTRYKAFYCINAVCRDLRDYRDLSKLYSDYGGEFECFKSYSHIKAIFDIEGDCLYDYDVLLNSTYENAVNYPENAGFLHMFADAFATVWEKGGLASRRAFLEEWYERALKAVERAIELENGYAKFYCTKARILLAEKKFEEATVNINKAISYEDSKRGDYPIRMSKYNYYKLLIYFENRLDSCGVVYDDADGLAVDEAVCGDKPEAYEGKKPFVFVSYAHSDSVKVFEFIRALQERGVRVWYDKGIHVGKNYAEVIAKRLIASQAYIFMISPSAINRYWVRKEFSLAGDCQKQLLPVFVSPTELPDGMKFTLAGDNAVYTYKSTLGQVVEEVVKSLPAETVGGEDD